MPAMVMEHEADPAVVLLDKLGKALDTLQIFNNQVLLAIYDRPAKTKTGILLPDQYRDEERFQGKACLIVAIGAQAFRDPEGRWFVNDTFDIGDWVIIRPSDGFPISIIGGDGRTAVPCRLVNDTAIRMRVQAPDRVW